MSEVEVDEDSLFEDAVSDEQKSPADPETRQEEQPEPEQTSEAEVELTPEGGKPAVDDNASQVPSWRVREINEEKRQLADRVRMLEAEKSSWQTRQQQPQAERKEPEKANKPDPLLDPEGYARDVRESIRQELLAERREESLQNAADKYKDEFVEAYRAAQQMVDPALRARMQASRDPGETLIKWHRENKQRTEIGDDLSAYKQRLLDEALKDGEFRKRAMEAWRNEAQPQSNGRPKIELPPSMNGLSRSNATLRSAHQQDVSDDALWNEATA